VVALVDMAMNIKEGRLLEQMRNYQLLKKDSGVRSLVTQYVTAVPP
jgi:hypothetical protein